MIIVREKVIVMSQFLPEGRLKSDAIGFSIDFHTLLSTFDFIGHMYDFSQMKNCFVDRNLNDWKFVNTEKD